MSRRWETTLMRPNKPHMASETATPTGWDKNHTPPKPTPTKANPNGYEMPAEFSRNRANVWQALVNIGETNRDGPIHVLVGLSTSNQPAHWNRLKLSGASGYSPTPELVSIARDVAQLEHYRAYILSGLRAAVRAKTRAADIRASASGTEKPGKKGIVPKPDSDDDV